jgi:hypothetical protein
MNFQMEEQDMKQTALFFTLFAAGCCWKPALKEGQEQQAQTAPAVETAPAAEEKPAPEPKGAPSDEDLKGRLADLNDLCGDTWCEGEYDYKFTKLACEGKSCDLSFTAKYYDGKKTYEAMVKVTGFTDVVPDEDGSFDEAVGEALMKWEQAPKK